MNLPVSLWNAYSLCFLCCPSTVQQLLWSCHKLPSFLLFSASPRCVDYAGSHWSSKTGKLRTSLSGKPLKIQNIRNTPYCPLPAPAPAPGRSHHTESVSVFCITGPQEQQDAVWFSFVFNYLSSIRFCHYSKTEETETHSSGYPLKSCNFGCMFQLSPSQGRSQKFRRGVAYSLPLWWGEKLC